MNTEQTRRRQDNRMAERETNASDNRSVDVLFYGERNTDPWGGGM